MVFWYVYRSHCSSQHKLTVIVEGVEMFHGSESARSWLVKVGEYILDLSRLSVGCNRWYKTRILSVNDFSFCSLGVAFSLAYLVHFVTLPRNIGDTTLLGYITNIVLHTYATVFICIRLLHHRRMILACLGDTANTTRHIRIIGILLVLAVINLPATITCGFGMRSGSVLGEVMLPIVVGIQVSWLITKT